MGRGTGTSTAAKKNKKEEDALQEKGFKVGDEVFASIGSGKVFKIARTEAEHDHPPKVFFKNHDTGKEYCHNPSILNKKKGGAGGQQEEEDDEEEEDGQ